MPNVERCFILQIYCPEENYKLLVLGIAILSEFIIYPLLGQDIIDKVGIIFAEEQFLRYFLDRQSKGCIIWQQLGNVE